MALMILDDSSVEELITTYLYTDDRYIMFKKHLAGLHLMIAKQRFILTIILTLASEKLLLNIKHASIKCMLTSVNMKPYEIFKDV